MRDKGDFAAGLLVGGLVGALIGLLLAPASGDELRRVVGRRAAETVGRVRDGAGQLADRVCDEADQTSTHVRQQAQAAGRRVRAKVEAMLGGIQQTVEEAVANLAPGEGPAPGLGEAAATTEGDGEEA